MRTHGAHEVEQPASLPGPPREAPRRGAALEGDDVTRRRLCVNNTRRCLNACDAVL